MSLTTPAQDVKQSMEAADKFYKELLKDPDKARAFLVKIGLAEKCASAPNGVQLAKQYR